MNRGIRMDRLRLFIFIVLLAVLPAQAGLQAQCVPDTLSQTLHNPDPMTGDNFGHSVAASNDVIVVGALYDDGGAPDAGMAYTFDATDGTLITPLMIPSPQASDNFGSAVAISGDFAVVGAPGKDNGATDAGAAYVFNARTGALITTLNNPAPNPLDAFGVSVGISGNLAVVGAPLDDTGAPNGGRAYVFNASTGALVATLPNPTALANDEFGRAVAISGEIALVGSPGNNTGAVDAGTAHLFNATTGSLHWTLYNPAYDVGDNFGSAVALSGNVAVIAAPYDDVGATDAGAVYLFSATQGQRSKTITNPAPGMNDNFGNSVAVSGTVVMVGASRDDAAQPDSGTAYEFNSTTGLLTETLDNPAPGLDDRFGASVAVSGTVSVVGALNDDSDASDAGIAYVFSCSTPTPSPSPTPTPVPTCHPVAALAMSFSPDTVTINAGETVCWSGLSGHNVVEVDETSWNADEDDPLAGGFTSGGPGAVSAFSHTFLVPGTYYYICQVHISMGMKGRVIVLGPTPTPEPCAPDSISYTLLKPVPTMSERFGKSVAISGSAAIVGVPSDSPGGVTSSGSAYVFNSATGALIRSLNNPTPATFDSFGTSVAILGNVAVVGASGDDPGGIQDAGIAYVFDITTGSLIATLNNPTPAALDHFGNAVSISGNLVAVGAFEDDTAGSGLAFVFNATTGALITPLYNPSTIPNDFFGASVSISGDLVIVGTFNAAAAYVFKASTGVLVSTLIDPGVPEFNTFGWSVAIDGTRAVVGATYGDSAVVDAGQAYVFDALTGALMATLINPDPPNDLFGESVSISGDTVLVASPFNDPGGVLNAGTVYAFNAVTGALERTLNAPVPGEGDNFGSWVSIDGNLAVMGAKNAASGAVDDAGAAYVYSCIPGQETPTPTPTPTPSPTETPVEPCVPSAHERTVSNPAPDPVNFFSAAMDGDLFIEPGYPLETSPGVYEELAYVFSASTGALVSTLAHQFFNFTEGFGSAVDISGTVAVVAAPFAPTDSRGRIYVFDALTGVYARELYRNDGGGTYRLGRSVAIDGSVVVAGGIDTNFVDAYERVWVFNVTTGDIIQTLSGPVPGSGEGFGHSVAISGNKAVVGAPLHGSGSLYHSGLAYVYNTTTGALISTLTPPSSAMEDEFGKSVAISGNLALIGAHGQKNGQLENAGKAYVLNATTGALVATLNDPLPTAEDHFGWSVSIDADLAMVGAFEHDPGFPINRGTAHIFNALTGALEATLKNPVPSDNSFGSAVSISGNRALVGSEWYADAFIYTCPRNAIRDWALYE